MTAKNISRRDVLGATAVAGTGIALGAAASPAALNVTPPHTEGPFYPIADQSDKDFDLTRIGDDDVAADGEIITVAGQVLDDAGTPIVDAVVDIWQANAAGRYAHERDPNPAPLDPHFQGWAILKTDGEGRYRFKTIRPGAYPVDNNWTRPPHIHFKVSRRGYRDITTQMYFENEPLNDVDQLLNALPQDLQPTLIAKRDNDTAPFHFDVVLAKV